MMMMMMMMLVMLVVLMMFTIEEGRIPEFGGSKNEPRSLSDGPLPVVTKCVLFQIIIFITFITKAKINICQE